MKKKKTFYAMNNKDAADEYIDALVQAGYIKIDKMVDADFMLIDHEHKGNRRESIEKFVRQRPVFIYPHVPYSWWAWDGINEPLPVCCNFVVGPAAVRGMKSYGYPYRVEAVGFTGCDVRDFTPTSGKHLVFSPPHLLGNGKYPLHSEVLAVVKKASAFIIENIKAFDGVTVHYSYQGIEPSGLGGFIGVDGVTFQEVNAYRTAEIRKKALAKIKKGDIIIGTNTFVYMAVAYGVPTIFFGNGLLARMVKSYHKYRDYYEYPLDLERMSIEDVLNTRLAPNERVEAWKEDNIGIRFDRQKFVDVVWQYV